MREFRSINWYTMNGRKVVGVRLDREEEREGLLSRLTAEGGVIVDGVAHQIDGIESFAVTPLREGMEICLRIVD